MQDAQGDGTGISSSPVFDTTPIIQYSASGGRASSITTYCIWNGTDLGSSTYGLKEREEYWEHHCDPEHGGQSPRPIERSRLEEIDRMNPRSIPILSVLGTRRDQVEELLEQLGIEAKHI